jgi:hypothetical protein
MAEAAAAGGRMPDEEQCAGYHLVYLYMLAYIYDDCFSTNTRTDITIMLVITLPA